MSASKQLRFDGKVALVTGGAGGLGRAYAIELARRGAEVAIGDLAQFADDGAELIRQAGWEVLALSGNVAKEVEAIALVDQTVAHYNRIDILINNAGNAIGGNVLESSAALIGESLNTHLLGSLWIMQAALAQMARQGYGRIVNTASSLGAFGQAGALPYACAKASIIAMTKCAAQDFADPTSGVRINAVAPVAYTPMAKSMLDGIPTVDKARLTEEAVAPVVAYLCHEDCALNGEVLSAQGGRAARIFSAVGPGFVSDALIMEDVKENLATIMSTDEFKICTDAVDEFAFFP